MERANENLSFNTRKSLCNHLGDLAGAELAEFLQHLQDRLDRLERTKVDITPIVPEGLPLPIDTVFHQTDAG